MERIHHDIESPVSILLGHENLLALEALLSDLGQNLIFAQSSEEVLEAGKCVVLHFGGVTKSRLDSGGGR